MQQPPASTGLEAVIRQGALRRQHFYMQLIRSALPATAVACLMAIGIYISVMVLAARSDWTNILIVAAAAALIPLVAVSLLVIEARRTHPFSMSLAVMLFAASFAVAVVSATRVPISYVAIALTLPSSLFFVTLANVAMSRRLRHSVALLDFPGAQRVIDILGWPLPVVGPDQIGMDFRRILIDPTTHHSPQWTQSLAKMYLRGLEIEGWPSYVESYLGRVDLADFDLADISYSPTQILYYRCKRLFDVLGVMLLALPAGIICALIWTYIRIIDGGPSVFVQQRRGYGGSVFRLFKFRTMRRGDHKGSTTANDDRILPGCRILRQMRLDELPQLYNILRGDMSFIGPRPVAVPVAEALEARVPLYINRHILQPGLTGWAQVSQGYAETEEEEVEKLAYDLYYLKHVSLDLDIIIIFRTIRTIFLRFGAR